MDFENLPSFYEELEKKFFVTNADLDAATYTNVDSNFVFSANYARHRWFNYKEGFSPVLVEKLFNEYKLQKDAIICDPFCGAGTTLTVAKARGMASIGFEVNPFAAFITRIKTADYSSDDISKFQNVVEGVNSINQTKKIDLPENEYICRMFESEMMQTQLHIKSYISQLDESKERDLLFFAWLCTLEKCSLYRKAGNGLKIKKNPPTYEEGQSLGFVYRLIRDKASAMIEDYSNDDNGPIPTLYEESATELRTKVGNDKLDLVLFSPPYANCFDYTKIYYLELWFGGFIDSRKEQKKIRMKSVRSHCHATWPDRYTDFHLAELNDELIPLLKQQKLWTKRIPDMLNGYFADMEEVLKQVYSSLKQDGHCDIVVSNSAYAGIIVPTDLFLAMIGEKIGFNVDEIAVERLIITSSQQYKKTQHIRKYLRESIVKLRK